MVRICFFFQAEDGIRGFHVTGVQTCALPILYTSAPTARRARVHCPDGGFPRGARSEERRVGKECRSRWSPPLVKKDNGAHPHLREIYTQRLLAHCEVAQNLREELEQAANAWL